MKLLGAACMMLATIGYTGYLLEKQKLHRDVLQSLVSMAELLAGYINYERLTMEEAFLRLSGNCRGVVREAANCAVHGGMNGAVYGDANGTVYSGGNGVFHDGTNGVLHNETKSASHSVLASMVAVVARHIADRLAAGTDESFEAVWRDVFCAEAPNLFLKEEELSLVLEMGKSLGGADIETQVRCLQGGARRLEKKLSEAERELAEKRRLYRYLGVAVGAMAVLVLI